MTAASWRTIHTNGIRMAVSEQGAGLPVVLCHGFPEIAYSWRHQMPALAAAGFRAIAPDQRGYGETDRPAAVSDYDIHQLTADLVGLLDALGLERAVVPLAETRTPRHGRNLVEVVTGSEPPGRLLLSEDELQIYVRAFERTGFTGGIDWYRNLDRNWETTPQLAGAKVEVPALM